MRQVAVYRDDVDVGPRINGIYPGTEIVTLGELAHVVNYKTLTDFGEWTIVAKHDGGTYDIAQSGQLTLC